MARHQLVLLVAALALGEHPPHRSLDARFSPVSHLEKIFVFVFCLLHCCGTILCQQSFYMEE